MKIFDRTPLQDEKGQVSFTARVQGTLKYGLNWYNELESQKAVIAQLERMLEKGAAVIRNFTLPGSDIIIPLILVSTSGIWVVYATPVKGFFEARGDQWNVVVNGRGVPDSINLIDRLAKLTRAFQKYLEIQRVDKSIPVEAVLIATDPGAHVEAIRPVVRIVLSDAIKQFATSILQTRPVLQNNQVYDLAERLVEARPVNQPPAPASLPAAGGQVEPSQSPSRARAIFKAAETSQPFNADDLGFAFEEGESPPTSQPVAPRQQEGAPSQKAQRAEPEQKKRGPLGLSSRQLVVLVVMLVIECLVIGGAGVVLYLTL